MKYMGSKARIIKDIAPIIQSYIDENNITTFIDCFVGGGNVIDHIQCEHRVGNDISEYLIELYKNLDKLETLPESVSKEHYSEVRDCFNKGLDTFPKWYMGMIGFLASYNGRFFDGGYAGVVNTKAGTTRDYYAEAKRNLLKQIPNLTGICWLNKNYVDLEFENSLLYCDIPYKDVKQYNTSKGFNHDDFWNWVREQSKKNIVLISEQQAPDDINCIWQQEVTRTVDNTKRVQAVEKLFICGVK